MHLLSVALLFQFRMTRIRAFSNLLTTDKYVFPYLSFLYAFHLSVFTSIFFPTLSQCLSTCINELYKSKIKHGGSRNSGFFVPEKGQEPTLGKFFSLSRHMRTVAWSSNKSLSLSHTDFHAALTNPIAVCWFENFLFTSGENKVCMLQFVRAIDILKLAWAYRSVENLHDDVVAIIESIVLNRDKRNFTGLASRSVSNFSSKVDDSHADEENHFVFNASPPETNIDDTSKTSFTPESIVKVNTAIMAGQVTIDVIDEMYDRAFSILQTFYFPQFLASRHYAFALHICAVETNRSCQSFYRRTTRPSVIDSPSVTGIEISSSNVQNTNLFSVNEKAPRSNIPLISVDECLTKNRELLLCYAEFCKKEHSEEYLSFW